MRIIFLFLILTNLSVQAQNSNEQEKDISCDKAPLNALKGVLMAQFPNREEFKNISNCKLHEIMEKENTNLQPVKRKIACFDAQNVSSGVMNTRYCREPDFKVGKEIKNGILWKVELEKIANQYVEIPYPEAINYSESGKDYCQFTYGKGFSFPSMAQADRFGKYFPNEVTFVNFFLQDIESSTWLIEQDLNRSGWAGVFASYYYRLLPGYDLAADQKEADEKYTDYSRGDKREKTADWAPKWNKEEEKVRIRCVLNSN